ncbi:16S rRNA (adenine(1518)-N(6)/adenine(1519)-N(6))-dimethyltransferase RsmA [Candidatus Acetothermia bacterium]|jgi:16S rRNA (adenine1518-N6/adenine1519-N6)-dimethyltransferase|nr:16S rRNA (adenine(1518)-N(6)/adenine(1519)-N(6))-dimethyltransferase RsmA [Candidatus Acetothermia bacterium]MCI2432439.1 16S rRNA (adenine(1518)-N(6)/adenine(1519)-N(6))-dimethyltransferase RsmA [Candidatus Acetothermia bacterium]MCI2436304.1 16S rRNA (adenine(1518)-N(6)/adenine(1519)-N(6))-dimethyltransferase RsmA [Candidatus Acetothermia bacterium]
MSLTNPSVVRELLARDHIRLKKRWGQNFLVDAHIVEKIISSVRLGSENTVLEIGAGIGTLTQKLAERAARVIAVEIDTRLIPLLRENLKTYSHAEILCQDFLEFDLKSLPPQTKVVGNLPYYITAPILEKLIAAHQHLHSALVMVQLEVAEKLSAQLGTRAASAITVFAQSFADVQHLMKVSKNCFFPKPDVDSALVRLEFLRRPRFQAPEEIFFRVVRAAFNLRRKMLKQALSQSPFLALERELVLEALARAEIDPTRRGETLSLEEFDRLALQIARAQQ